MTKANRIELSPAKTYASRENAIKAVEKVYGPHHSHPGSADVRYIVAQTGEGRWFPLFIGNSAIAHGAHIFFPVAN